MKKVQLRSSLISAGYVSSRFARFTLGERFAATHRIRSELIKSNEKYTAISKAFITYSERDATLQPCGNVGLLSLRSFTI
jgi:hypothetical protein